MFKLTAKTLTGEEVRSFERKEDGIAAFKEFNKIYKSVTLIESVTTTVETIIRDSSKPEG
jgi:hypothetical protein